MTPFIGRTSETAFLEKSYRERGGSFIPVYGRRRVGKSELILQFLHNKPALYFVGSRISGAAQIHEFLQAAASSMSMPVVAEIQTRDWKTAFQAVCSQLGTTKKIIIALDEFQWMAEGSPELPSVLQQLWDLDWSTSGKVMLILCGSYIGFMEREVLGSRSPLFGRRTGQILLRPFTHVEAGQFHPNYSFEEKARTYFLCGGIPLYLNFFKQNRSVEMNIQSCFLDEYAPLYREAEFLMREELTNVAMYYTIMMAFGQGQCTVKSLAQSADMDNRALPHYLQQLQSLGYIEKQYPITGQKPSVKSVRYAIADPLLRFWFSFVYPQISSIRHLGVASAYAAKIKPNLDSYFGKCFESLCREALPSIYNSEGVTANHEVGQYWDKKCQIDVVGYRHDGWTDIGECKWGNRTTPASVISEIEERVACYPNPRNATINRRIFVRSPWKKDIKGFVVHSLKDLYASND